MTGYGGSGGGFWGGSPGPVERRRTGGSIERPVYPQPKGGIVGGGRVGDLGDLRGLNISGPQRGGGQQQQFAAFVQRLNQLTGGRYADVLSSADPNILIQSLAGLLG